MICPGEDAAFVASMEHVLDCYQCPLDTQSAMVNMDEQFVQLKYVKEVWVESLIVEEDLGDESLQVINVYVHESDQRVLAFTLRDNNLWDLLPSLEIVVRYYLKA